MTYDEISRMNVDELRRELRAAKSRLAKAMDLVHALNVENDTLLNATQKAERSPCPNCTCSGCLPPDYLAKLQADLDELEATDPEVKAAAESYDEAVRKLTGQPFRWPAGEPEPEWLDRLAERIVADVRDETARLRIADSHGETGPILLDGHVDIRETLAEIEARIENPWTGVNVRALLAALRKSLEVHWETCSCDEGPPCRDVRRIAVVLNQDAVLPPIPP